MNRVIVFSLAAGLVAVASGLFLWPHSDSRAQVNAEGCSCSRPTTIGSGREQLAVYYCACPAVQCVLTATTAGSAAPPNLVQNCRTDRGETLFSSPPK